MTLHHLGFLDSQTDSCSLESTIFMLLQSNTLEIQAGYKYSRVPAKGTTTKRQQIVFCVGGITLSHHQLNLKANRNR